MKKMLNEGNQIHNFISSSGSGRVSDPYSFFTDPDPEDPDGGQYGSGSRALMTKNWKKITAEKKIKFFLIKNFNLPIPRPP
jgi:hypothetical protein